MRVPVAPLPPASAAAAAGAAVATDGNHYGKKTAAAVDAGYSIPEIKVVLAPVLPAPAAAACRCCRRFRCSSCYSCRGGAPTFPIPILRVIRSTVNPDALELHVPPSIVPWFTDASIFKFPPIVIPSGRCRDANLFLGLKRRDAFPVLVVVCQGHAHVYEEMLRSAGTRRHALIVYPDPIGSGRIPPIRELAKVCMQQLFLGIMTSREWLERAAYFMVDDDLRQFWLWETAAGKPRACTADDALEHFDVDLGARPVAVNDWCKSISHCMA